MNESQPTIPALRALGDVFAQLDAETAETSRSPLRLRVAMATMIAVAGIGALTPPGQAVAERLGDLVGLGGESTPEPTVVSAESVDLGTGRTPSGARYELAASHARGAGEVCISLLFPDRKKATTTCGYPPDPALPDRYGSAEPADQTALGRPFFYAAGDFGLTNSLGADAGALHGNASSDVAAVEVSYRGDAGEQVLVPTRLLALEGEAQSEIAVERPLKAYVAFPPARGLDSIEVTAYDSSGNTLATYEGGDHLSQPPAGKHEGSKRGLGETSSRPYVRRR